MVLINCPACKKEVSDEAECCVNCGHPVRAKQKHLGVRAMISTVLIAIGLFLVLEGAVMPGAVWFGFFMIAFGALVLLAMLWKAATN